MENENEENEEDEMTDVDREKIEKKHRRIKMKMEQFMLEVGEELIDEESIRMVQDKVKKTFKQNGIPYRLSYLKSFKEGIEMGASAIENGKDIFVMFLVSVSRIIADIEKDMNIQVDKATKENK